MAALSDLLGALVSEFTAARVHADIEAVRMAEVYRSTPLLEGAPVPRFRLPELSLDIPIAVKDVPEGGAIAHKRVAPPTVKQINDVVKHAVAESGLPLTKAQTDALTTAMKTELKGRWSSELAVPQVLVLSQTVSLNISTKLSGIKPAMSDARRRQPEAEAVRSIEPKVVARFQRALQQHLQRIAIGPDHLAPRIDIIAETSALREVENDTVILRMNVRLKEDGFEIVEVEQPDGSSTERFVSE